MSRPRCFCGCGRPAIQQHHVIYRQELKKAAGTDPAARKKLISDPRNLVWVASPCHGRHHSRHTVFPLTLLPDAVFEFAAEVLGAGPGYIYLEKRYGGDDPRLEAML